MPGDEEDAIGLDQKPEGTGKPDRSASAPRHRVGVAGGDSTPCMSGLGKNNASGADRAGSVWAYDRDAGARDAKDTVDAVAKLPGCTGKVAVLGYCLGALMLFLTAVRHGVDVAVAYHGGDTEKYLGEIDGLHAPMLMHLAEEDEFISKAAQAEIKTALAKKPNATVYSYPGQHHAFSRHNGAHYNPAAAALANGRTSEFLHQRLR